jgi:membrane-associated phospholipid phosphatase
VIRVFATTFILPAFAIFLMHRLKLISSIEMTDKQERIGPFIATGIFYLWVFRSVLNDSNMPTAFLIAALGTTIGLFACFLINLFFKISLHATGSGGFVGMVLITMWLYSYGAFSMWLPFVGVCTVSINFILILSVFLAGAVGSARLVLGAHTSKELYAGFVLGLLCQYIALQVFV